MRGCLHRSIDTPSIVRDGCSDITAEHLEIELIKRFRSEFEKEIKSSLRKSNISEMGFSPIQYLLTPKNRYVFDYRKAAIISPMCAAKFLTIVFQYADKIEAARIPVTDNIVFSYRFSPSNDGIFDTHVGYSQWLEETKSRAEDPGCNYVVRCDIAAFYDRVNIHRIESTLISIGVDRALVGQTNDLLLMWSKKDSYGIPIGNVASRILAEAALIDIDQYLISEGIKFTRYVDDYRLFAPSLLVAQEWMNRLTTRLFRDGLMLNTGKTQVSRVEIRTEPTLETSPEAENTAAGAEAVLKVITKLTGGYSRISRRFVMPAEDRLHVFKEIDLAGEIELLKQQPIVEFEGIQKVVIASLVQQDYDALLLLAQVCYQYLYGLDYFIDMLLKNADFIPEGHRGKIADFYAGVISEGQLYAFEWHCATLAKLLSHEAYFRKRPLLALYKTPAKDVSTYGSVVALDGLQGKLTRSEFKTIREFFDRSDDWEKRRLLRLSCALPEEERKAWGRAIKATIPGDFLGRKLCDIIIKGEGI